MATTMQAKFEAAMQRLADERDLDLVIESKWANAGHYSFQRRGDFEPLLRFPYDFQHGRSSFCGMTEDPGPLGYISDGDPAKFLIIEGAEHDLAITRAAELLNMLGEPPKASAMTPAEEALTQCQHIAHDTLVKLGTRAPHPDASKGTVHGQALERINSIAEGGEPTPEFRAMLKGARAEGSRA